MLGKRPIGESPTNPEIETIEPGGVTIADAGAQHHTGRLDEMPKGLTEAQAAPPDFETANPVIFEGTTPKPNEPINDELAPEIPDEDSEADVTVGGGIEISPALQRALSITDPKPTKPPEVTTPSAKTPPTKKREVEQRGASTAEITALNKSRRKVEAILRLDRNSETVLALGKKVASVAAGEGDPNAFALKLEEMATMERADLIQMLSGETLQEANESEPPLNQAEFAEALAASAAMPDTPVRPKSPVKRANITRSRETGVPQKTIYETQANPIPTRAPRRPTTIADLKGIGEPVHPPSLEARDTQIVKPESQTSPTAKPKPDEWPKPKKNGWPQSGWNPKNWKIFGGGKK